MKSQTEDAEEMKMKMKMKDKCAGMKERKADAHCEADKWKADHSEEINRIGSLSNQTQ